MLPYEHDKTLFKIIDDNINFEENMGNFSANQTSRYANIQHDNLHIINVLLSGINSNQNMDKLPHAQ